MLSPSKQLQRATSVAGSAGGRSGNSHIGEGTSQILNSPSHKRSATTATSNTTASSVTNTSLRTLRDDTQLEQQQDLRAALQVARSRAEFLEKRLNSRVASDHFVGVDRLMMEEVFERRSIEAHHMELLHFVNNSWERVRCAMSDTEAAMLKYNDMEVLCRDSEREAQRWQNTSASQDKIIATLTQQAKDYAKAMKELTVVRRDQTQLVSARVSAERQVAKLRLDKRKLKGRVEELEQTIASFRTDLEKLSSNHSHIVGDLEHSLKVMLLSSSAATPGSTQDTTTDITASSRSNAAMESCDNGTAPTTVFEWERRAVELRFRCQDAVRELQDARTINRDLRAQITSEALSHQEASREWQAKVASLEEVVAQLRKERGARTREVTSLQSELARCEGMSRELGKCRGQLAIAERKIELLEKERNKTSTAASVKPSSSAPLQGLVDPAAASATSIRSTAVTSPAPSILSPLLHHAKGAASTSLRSTSGEEQHHVSFIPNHKGDVGGGNNSDSDSSRDGEHSKEHLRASNHAHRTANTKPHHYQSQSDTSRDSQETILFQLKRMQHLRLAGSQAIANSRRTPLLDSSLEQEWSRDQRGASGRDTASGHTPEILSSSAPQPAARNVRDTDKSGQRRRQQQHRHRDATSCDGYSQPNASISSVEVVVEDDYLDPRE